MPPTPGETGDLLSRREVRVAEVPFAQLLIAHHAAGTTGTLVARRGPVEKRVLLERGQAVDCRSNLVHETLNRFLVSLGRLTEAQAAEVLADSVQRGVRIGEVLIERGHIDASELTRLLQQNLAKKLLDLFTWSDGELRLDTTPVRLESALKVRVPQLVLTGVTRFMPQAAIERALHPHAAAPLALTPAAAAAAGALRLPEREQRVLAALDRPQRIEELLAASGLSTAEAARSLYALLVLGLVAPADAPPPPAALPTLDPMLFAPRTPAPAPPVAAAAAPGKPPPPDRSRLLNSVSQAFLDHRQKDSFELLGLREEADEREIEAAFLAFAREFAPLRFEEPGLALVADYARELFLAGARAFAELADRDRRSELVGRRQRRREEAEQARRAVHQQRIETDLLDPALQFRKGMALLEAGKTKAALQQLEFAADCDPQNGRYRAEVARCRFLLSPTSGGKQALEELAEAERVDPNAVELFLYHGEIAAELGRFEEAEGALRQAARLLGPTDRRALDALRELTTKRKKRR